MLMSKLIQLFNPTPVLSGDPDFASALSTRPQSSFAQSEASGPLSSSRLKGMVVGFIDSAKPNFRFLVEDLSSILSARYGVAQVLVRQKRAASLAAPEPMLHELLHSCDLVIAGSGD